MVVDKLVGRSGGVRSPVEDVLVVVEVVVLVLVVVVLVSVVLVAETVSVDVVVNVVEDNVIVIVMICAPEELVRSNLAGDMDTLTAPFHAFVPRKATSASKR